MTKTIQRPYRYDFFTIWGNGLDFTDDILWLLRKERNIKIIRIESRTIRNMRRFVFELYKCDTVPVRHLRSKLKYLFKVPPKILIIFVKNYSPEEEPVGFDAFRKVQCHYINRIKWQIRELYNPRQNGRRTEEHIVHASDYEEQVDYLLKLMGYAEGLQFLEEDSFGISFKKPYHVKKPDAYVFKKILLKDLRASILLSITTKKNSIRQAVFPLDKTPHFRGLCGGSEYEYYIKKFKYTFLTDDHYPEKIMLLNELGLKEIEQFPPIIVSKEKEYFRILDGVHRATVALYHNLVTVRCVEFL